MNNAYLGRAKDKNLSFQAYGGWADDRDVRTSEVYHLVKQLKSNVPLRDEPWLQISVSREEAEDILRSENDGTFLVRLSSHCCFYALSVKTNDTVKHLLISWLRPGYGIRSAALIGREGGESSSTSSPMQQFESLPDLIAAFPNVLKFPARRQDAEATGTAERSALKAIQTIFDAIRTGNRCRALQQCQRGEQCGGTHVLQWRVWAIDAPFDVRTHLHFASQSLASPSAFPLRSLYAEMLSNAICSSPRGLRELHFVGDMSNDHVYAAIDKASLYILVDSLERSNHLSLCLLNVSYNRLTDDSAALLATLQRKLPHISVTARYNFFTKIGVQAFLQSLCSVPSNREIALKPQYRLSKSKKAIVTYHDVSFTHLSNCLARRDEFFALKGFHGIRSESEAKSLLARAKVGVFLTYFNASEPFCLCLTRKCESERCETFLISKDSSGYVLNRRPIVSLQDICLWFLVCRSSRSRNCMEWPMVDVNQSAWPNFSPDLLEKMLQVSALVQLWGPCDESGVVTLENLFLQNRFFSPAVAENLAVSQNDKKLTLSPSNLPSSEQIFRLNLR